MQIVGRVARWWPQYALILAGKRAYFGPALEFPDDIPWDERAIGTVVRFDVLPPDPGGRNPKAVNIVRQVS
jgi:hypothetical protein